MYKEIRFCIWILTWPFMIMTALMLAPDYPSIVGVFYCLISILNTFRLIQLYKDNEFTLLLPVSRSQVVLSKHLTVALIECLQLLVAVPFAIWRNASMPGGTVIGIDPNYAFFGFCFISFAAFNLFFLPLFFRTGYKTGLAFLCGAIGFIAAYGMLECLIGVLPGGRDAVDSLNPATIPLQLVYLAAGLLVYIAAFYLSYRISVKNFAKVNL
jgi:hypothetical protein